MKPDNLETFDMKTMIADHMENGFLENIVDMFKHDHSLYSLLGDFLTDERIRVRLGFTALVETLKKEDPVNVSKASPYIIPLLKDDNPMLRGDAAYLLGVIGDRDLLPLLKELQSDENPSVREIIKESIQDILQTNP